MKKLSLLFLSLVTCLSSLLTGCVSATSKPVVAVPTAQSIAQFVTPMAQAAVPLVLEKNPSYAPAIDILADSIPVLLGSGNLTPEGITAALNTLNAKASLALSPDAIAFVANGLSIAISQYEATYGLKVSTATDPGVQIILAAFSTGLKNGVATWKTAHPSP